MIKHKKKDQPRGIIVNNTDPSEPSPVKVIEKQ